MTSEVKQESQQVAAQPVVDQKEYNFAQLRKQLEAEKAEKLRIQQESRSLADRLAKLEKAREVPDDDQSDEPYVDHKRLDRRLQKFETILEEKFEKKVEMKAREIVEQERQQAYIKQNPDFHTMMSAENIEAFANAHPQIAERLLRMPDNFDRQALVYEQMKVLNASKKEAEKPSIQEKIDQNRRGPFYRPTGIGNAPYSQVGDFSPAGQKNAYEKLQQLKAGLRLGG